MKKTLINIGAKIKELRKKGDFTQENIAHFLKVHQSLISDYEAGTRSISVGALEKLAALFGVDVAVFYNENIEIKPLVFAHRANKIMEGDLDTICAINRVALNSNFMNKLLKADK